MDKDTTRNLLIATGVFLVLVWLGPMLAPPAPPRPAPTPDGPMAPGSPAAPAVQEAAPSAPGAVGATGETVPSAAPSGALQVLEADSEVTLTLGAEPFDAQASRKEAARHARAEPFRMHLTLSNVGAAVESATMTDHAEELKGSARYRLLAPVERGDGTPLRSLAVERINVDGVDVLLHDKKWHAQPVRPCTFADGGAGVEAVFHLDIQREGVPALQVTRTWRLPRQAWELERHDLHSDIQVRNLDSQAHRVVVSYYGGLGVRQARPSSMDDRFIDLGVRAASGLVAGQRRTLHEITAAAGKDVPLYVSSAQDAAARLIWAATGNTYFTCTVAPLTPDAQDGPAYVTEVSAFDADGAAATTHDAAVRFVTKAEPLGAGQAVSYPAEVFLGEKEINGFRDVPAYKARNYYYQISQGYGSCTFSWLVEMMIWLLNSLFFMVRDFGWAIIVLVLIVRAMLHPITKKGQINMVRMQHRMQELAPKIEEIKKKFGNDKARMNQEMMKLNINPAGQLLTCLPMFIQMPIWVALWLSLNNNVLMRHEPFHLTWIHDLTAPDALYHFAAAISIPLIGNIESFNLLPFLMAIAMYLQQKLQPQPKPSPNMTEQQRQQQEMMQKMGPIMAVMMFFIFYSQASGLVLYIMCSSFFGTIEQWVIRRHIKEREAAGTLHAPQRLPPGDDGVINRKPQPGKESLWQRLQKAAENAQKAQAQRARGKPRR